MSIQRWSLGVILAASSLALGDVVELAPSKDNTLYQSTDGANSNGRGIFMFSGVNSAEAERRALVAFDLSLIPRGSTIQSAALTLHCARTVAATGTFAIHRVTADWGEGASDAGDPGGQGAASEAGDATWVHRFFPNERWARTGGDFVATASASANVGDIGFYTWSSAGLAADVAGWVNDPSSNFGWIVMNARGDIRNARRFDTRESTSPALRPKLRVEFTPPVRCSSDVDDGTGTGTPDGGVTIDDLLFFIFLLENGDSRADLDDGSGTGIPDGGVTIEDLLYFIRRYAEGC